MYTLLVVSKDIFATNGNYDIENDIYLPTLLQLSNSVIRTLLGQETLKAVLEATEDEADRKLEIAFAKMGEIRKRIDELQVERICYITTTIIHIAFCFI